MEKADGILQELISRNPAMGNLLSNSLRHHEQLIQSSRGNLQANCKALGIEEKEFNDNEALLLQKAADQKRWMLEHCSTCGLDIQDCRTCMANAPNLLESRQYDIFMAKVPICRKLAAYKQREKVSRLLGISGMGERFWGRRFSTFQVTDDIRQAYLKARKFCKDYEENSKTRGLMFMGPYGTGKTHLAAAILQELAEQGTPGVFVVVPELLNKLRRGIDDEKARKEGDELVDMAKTTPVLFLDDLGAQNPTAWVKEQLYLLVNYRYERMLPIVVTTNCRGAELEASIGTRVTSRIMEMAQPVIVDTKDYRRTAGGQNGR